MRKTLFPFIIMIFGCARIPEGIEAVRDLDVNRYLGTWYEIARLDHPFERGLVDVTATYTLNTDGSLRVVNRGFDQKKQQWKMAEGLAYFVSGPGRGRLRVSFFGPFYGGYNIIGLDRHTYSYALVCGNTRSYLWILARQPRLPGPTLDALVHQAETLGFDTDALIFVQHEHPPAP